MNQAQQLFGTPSDRAQVKVHSYMKEWVQSYIQHSPFMVMASSNQAGACDASPKGGKPGFVKVLDNKRLLIPDVAGNKLFQSYENIETNPSLGLVFFIPGLDATVRVNGKVRVLRKDDDEFKTLTLEVFQPDENAKLIQAILFEVDESYSHCPRALGFSKLWNTDVITDNKQQSPIAKWVPGT